MLDVLCTRYYSTNNKRQDSKARCLYNTARTTLDIAWLRMVQWSKERLLLAFLRMLAQPFGRLLASPVGGAAAGTPLHLAIPPGGLLRVLLEPVMAACVRPAEKAARVLRPQRGRHTNQGAATNNAALDTLSA